MLGPKYLSWAKASYKNFEIFKSLLNRLKETPLFWTPSKILSSEFFILKTVEKDFLNVFALFVFFKDYFHSCILALLRSCNIALGAVQV